MYFSRLSHLSVPYGLGGSRPGGYRLATLLRPFLNLKPLKMLVIAVAKNVIHKGRGRVLEKWVRKTRETDDRVYLMEGASNFQDEWENEVRGGESFWDQAVRYTDEWERRTNTKCWW
jgi:hypothetical protein